MKQVGAMLRAFMPFMVVNPKATLGCTPADIVATAFAGLCPYLSLLAAALAISIEITEPKVRLFLLRSARCFFCCCPPVRLRPLTMLHQGVGKKDILITLGPPQQSTPWSVARVRPLVCCNSPPPGPLQQFAPWSVATVQLLLD